MVVKQISTATFSTLTEVALWKPRLHGNCKPMAQCTICKDVLKYFGANFFFSFDVSSFPGAGTECDPTAQVKGKCTITPPLGGEAAAAQTGG